MRQIHRGWPAGTTPSDRQPNPQPNPQPNLLQTLLLTVLLAGIVALTPDPGQRLLAASGDFSKPIDVNADRSEFNEATGVQSLSGNVEIRQGTLSIRADAIKVFLADNKLSKIEGTGSPIVFQQRNNEGELVVGRCRAITYDAIRGRMILRGNAVLEQPKQKLTSDKIVFDSITQTVVAEGGQSGRVSITIQPPDQN